MSQKNFLKRIGATLGVSMALVGVLLFGTALVLVSSAGMAAPTSPSLGTSLDSAGRGLYGVEVSGDAPTPPSVGGIVAQVITVFFGLLGIIFVALMVYGGFQWMTAAGNPEQVKKAQKLMIDAVLGVLILMAASFISYWVLYIIATKIVVNPPP